MRFKLHPDFPDKKSFLLDIENHFNTSSNSIHKARNEIKIINAFVVKSFKIPHIINKIAYTFFRDSKAKKSFDNAIKVGEFTPKPLGYIEFIAGGLLTNSYYISIHFNYDFTIREPLLDVDFEDRDALFIAFTNFTYQLHQKGIYHKDYSPGNILIKKQDATYTFQIVDINRMEFKELSLEERLQNFSKLWADDEDLTFMITAYANLLDEEEAPLIEKALAFSRAHKEKKNMKKKLKSRFKR
ncbi:MAG TPA: hypothetical protein EYG95_07200 [Campylobacterales bacterium]|nr:hypothetical protein [Campylobacterales bacterium]